MTVHHGFDSTFLTYKDQKNRLRLDKEYFDAAMVSNCLAYSKGRN